jgi:hypothetical protein
MWPSVTLREAAVRDRLAARAAPGRPPKASRLIGRSIQQLLTRSGPAPMPSRRLLRAPAGGTSEQKRPAASLCPCHKILPERHRRSCTAAYRSGPASRRYPGPRRKPPSMLAKRERRPWRLQLDHPQVATACRGLVGCELTRNTVR